MNLLLERSKRREELVRLAKDSNVSKLAELFLAKYRTDLEHLAEGDLVEDHVPVGKDRFVEWLKETIHQYFPNLSGMIENERTLKDYAGQVGDAVAKSDTGVQNPLKDYKISKDPVFVKAQYTPAKATVEAPYQSPVERFRNNENQEQIIEKGYETGVQNQNLMDKMHPIKPFLSKEKGQETRIEEKKDALYDVFKENEALISPSAPNDDASTAEEGKKATASSPLQKLTRKAHQLFGPTTMVARQCPDHPGQQLSRVADNVRQCPLDGKVYDYTRGFTTEDGKKYNGGSVQAQSSIPPGSIIINLDKRASVEEKKVIAGITKKVKTASDTPKTHSFLYQILQYLPAESRERQILNYKFQHNLSLEDSIAKFEEAERLAAQQKAQTAPKTAAVDVSSIKSRLDKYSPQELEDLHRKLDIELEKKDDPEVFALFDLVTNMLQEKWSKDRETEKLRSQESKAREEAASQAARAELINKKWKEMEMTRGQFFDAVKTNYPITQEDGEWVVTSRVGKQQAWVFPTETDAKEKVLQLADWREYDKYDRQGDRGTVKRNPPVF